jgi:microcystin-dependent protein
VAEPFIGQISCYACNFAPRYWAQCRGQLLSIAQNTALFSILGTTFGGNGQTTFALPNLQGQAPMHWGTTSGLPATDLGEVQGVSTATLLFSEMPAHTHTAVAVSTTTGATRTAVPDNTSYLAGATAGNAAYDSTSPIINAVFAQAAISPAGGSQPHDNMQPYLALNLCIAVEGVFPSRN